MELLLPEGLSLQHFLDHYWQKRPLLMRGALREYSFPLTPEELAGLACEEEMESRLVIGQASGRWELEHGPFDETRFADLPESSWTLLVQDVDKYLPEVARLLQPFRFIPSWRFDDVMISYAVPGGSVGPHVDTYDVFLVQGQGRRRWQIDSHPDATALLPDLPIRILAEFRAEEEWVLERGDVLYLPPGVAHWGIAETDCMTWSVGLRDPSLQEMLDSFAQFLMERIPAGEHYRDPPLDASAPVAGIPPAPVRQTFSRLDEWLGDENLRYHWFGCFMTELKSHLNIEPPETAPDSDTIRNALERGGWLAPHPFSRLAWSTGPDGKALFFACGEAYRTNCQPKVLEALCSIPRVDHAALQPCLDDPSFLALLTELVALGYLELGQ